MDTLKDLAIIAMPLIVAYLGYRGVELAHRFQRLRTLEEGIQSERLQLYQQLLEPYTLLFASDEIYKRSFPGKTKDEHFQELTVNIDYWRTAFRITLFAPDEVVEAHKELMQAFYRGDFADSKNPRALQEMLYRVGRLTLAVRRSLGNSDTSLHPFEMIEWFTKDIRQFRDKNGRYPDLARQLGYKKTAGLFERIKRRD